MVNPKGPITGVIETDNKPYSFYLDGYSMVLLDAVLDPRCSSTIKPVDQFAHAISHKGNAMRLLIGQYDHPVVNTMKINLSSYIISTSNVHEYDLSYYDGIVFVGGTLSKLKHPRGVEIQFDEKANKNYIEYTDDKQTISFGLFPDQQT